MFPAKPLYPDCLDVVCKQEATATDVLVFGYVLHPVKVRFIMTLSERCRDAVGTANMQFEASILLLGLCSGPITGRQ